MITNLTIFLHDFTWERIMKKSDTTTKDAAILKIIDLYLKADGIETKESRHIQLDDIDA